ncbi:MAG: AAA family ATPase [Blastopirellula sp.]|nr:AAA family ATPase [Blastopirellula sp.]
MDNTSSSELVTIFERTLQDCKQLYLSSAQLCIEKHPALIPEAPREFMQLMGDLHRGLLIKVYASMVSVEMRWTPPEARLAQVLFYHTWKQQVVGGDLRRAIEHVIAEGRDLKWYSLVRPFDQIAPLRNRFGELETIIMRAANLIAKVNGEISTAETDMLRYIQQELNACLRTVPLDEPSQHAQANQLGPQAIQQMQRDTAALHQSQVISESGVEVEEGNHDPEPSLDNALEELDRLIGLDTVKEEVRTLTNLLQLQQQRVEHGLPTTPISLHMVFNGNPGTGKTTVARIIGQIYGGMGILKQGHLIETDRAGLVAEYAGQTATKANKKIDEALDGVLFIDEAYSLVAADSEDPYGREAIQILLKRMEDDRDRLVVILAGYPEPMKDLIASNPGLRSRFNMQMLFEDYKPSDMGHIFEAFCTRNQFEIAAGTRAKLLLALHWHYQRRDEHFGNGRFVRNLFENSIRNLANRVAGVVPISKELLTTFESEDIDTAAVPARYWERVRAEETRFAVQCVGCENSSVIPADYLGRVVRCSKCDQRFVASWGDPKLP